MPSKSSANAKTLTLFGFFAMTRSMVMTVYEYPTFATSGFHLVFFLIVGGLLWFLPVALCASRNGNCRWMGRRRYLCLGR
ncbi:hypothetical protein R2R32_12345 [Clostridium perfringens]|nr:hypothetical protein [Clostridium perfringens]